MSRRSHEDRRRSRSRDRDRHRHKDRRDRSRSRDRERRKDRERSNENDQKALPYYDPNDSIRSQNESNNKDTTLALVQSGDRPRKKRSRWAETDKSFIPGMPTLIPANLTPQQEKMYIIQLQLEDITRRLKTSDLGIPPKPEDRSPSPEPIYSSDGKRLNTREYRIRKKLEEDRQELVKQLMDMNPDFRPPNELARTGGRVTDKVFIPQEDHPHINFVGLLIGPRGNTLKALEKETGAKIIIRGKGSVKDGKLGRLDGQPMPGEDEPLHAYVQAPTPDAVSRAVVKINQIVEEGINVPEGDNDLRKAQLRELALLNGTLRETDGLARIRAMAETQTIATNNIICSFCGAAGHIASDCKINSGATWYNNQSFGQVSNPNERAKMDSEYTALMNELGVKGAKIPTNRMTFEPPPPGTQPNSNVGGNAFGGALEWQESASQPLPPGVEKEDLPPGYGGADKVKSTTSAPMQPPPPPGTASANGVPPPPKCDYQPTPSPYQQNVRYAYAMQPPPGGGFVDPSLYWNAFGGAPGGGGLAPHPGSDPGAPPPPGIPPGAIPPPVSGYPAPVPTYPAPVSAYSSQAYFQPPPPPPPGV